MWIRCPWRPLLARTATHAASASPEKKALIHQGTGNVLGVVSRDYRVVTHQEAVNLARDVCEKAFPGLSSVEWEAKRGAAPRPHVGPPAT